MLNICYWDISQNWVEGFGENVLINYYCYLIGVGKEFMIVFEYVVVLLEQCYFVGQ